MLIVEDVQFFSGRAKTQLELFHTLQHVLDAGGSVLLTGDRAPRDLVGLDERVRDQLGRGFVAELEMPDALVRRHILRSKAAAGGVHLPADCIDLLVESSVGSVRDVESMLIQVVTTSSLLGRTIDLELTHEAIALKSGAGSSLAPKTIATSEIVRIVATFFGKRPEALAGRSRRRDVLVPRQLAMYLAHRYSDASFTEIGRGLGRDHPAVRNAITKVERLVLENAPLRYQVEALSERIDQTLKRSDSAVD
jgi:chromosomal replication initiator protein